VDHYRDTAQVTTTLHPENSNNDSVNAHEGAHVNVNRFTEHSKLLPWLMLTAILAGFAVAFSMLTFFYMHDQMLRDQRSYEQMRVQVLSQNAILLREGFIRPGDEWMGPEGNLQFNPKLRRK
jgi:multisubunit Na+/H+ antiporter MnhC subunit